MRFSFKPLPPKNKDTENKINMAPVFDINAKADVLQAYLDQFKDAANVPWGLYVALSNGLKRCTFFKLVKVIGGNDYPILEVMIKSIHQSPT